MLLRSSCARVSRNINDAMSIGTVATLYSNRFGACEIAHQCKHVRLRVNLIDQNQQK
jgi:hypothetical protein